MNLVDLGLRPKEAVRFRRRADERWKLATVVRVERDGSVGLRDMKGAMAAIAVDGIEVRVTGPRGGTAWEPLAERIARAEQLDLF